jgi:hypothetical protein
LEADQDDKRKCSVVLDCWLEEDCGPGDSCNGIDSACGTNTLTVSPIAVDYAETVYDDLCGS